MLPRKPVKLSQNGRNRRGWPEPHRFLWVMLTPDRRALACKLEDGQLYELPLLVFAEHEEWDGSAAESVKLLDHGGAAVLRLVSGAEHDFAVDWVLHHCAPGYRYFKGHCAPPAIGPRIQMLRQVRAWSLGQLAARTGIATPNLSRLEHGKHVPSWATLEKLARAFAVPLGALLSGQHETRRGVAAAKLTLPHGRGSQQPRALPRQPSGSTASR